MYTDQHRWEVILDTLKALNIDGMSSDESDKDDNTHEETLNASVLLWRRDLDQFFDVIDLYRWMAGGAFDNEGTKPRRRFRGNRVTARLGVVHDGPRVSERNLVLGLKRSFYDSEWLGSRTIAYVQNVVRPVNEAWEWVNIGPVT
jgi:hypothetical protein